MFPINGNLCVKVAPKNRGGGEGGGWSTSCSLPAGGGGVVPSDDPALDLSLFIGARIAISGGTEEFKEVRTAVHHLYSRKEI